MLTFLCLNKAVAESGDFGNNSTIDQAVQRSVLINKYSNNPRELFILYTRAKYVKKGLSVGDIKSKTNEFTQLYDEQVNILKTKKLPDPDGAMETSWKLAHFVLEELAGKYAGSTGSAAATFLLDLTQPAVESFIASDAVKFSGNFLAQENLNSVLRVEKLVDFSLNALNEASPDAASFLRFGFASDVGVDINDSDSTLLAKNPDLGAYFSSQRTNRSLLDIQKDMALFSGDLSVFKDEILLSMNEEIDAVQNLITDGVIENRELFMGLNNTVYESTEYLGGEIGKNRLLLNTLVDDLLDKAEKERLRVIAEGIKKLKIAKASEQQAYLQLGASLLNKIDPKLGQTYSVVSNAALKINSAIDTFNSLGKIGDLGTAAMTMNIAEGAMAIMGLFQADQMSPEAQIMSQIAALQRQVQELRAEMNERFDIVDAKLNDILFAIDDGFNLVQGNLLSTVNLIAKNTQVALNTQSLLLAESDKIAELVRDLFLVPCVEFKPQGGRELADDAFTVCSIQLEQYATVSIKSNQIKYSQEMSGIELEAIFNTSNTDERTGDMIYSMFLERSGKSRTVDVMVSPEQWYMASSWYRDFLTASPSQTRRALPNYSFDEIKAIGQGVINFKSQAIDYIIGVDTLSGDCTIDISLASNIDCLTKLIESTTSNYNTRGIQEYFSDTNINLDFIELPLLSTPTPSTTKRPSFTLTSGFGVAGAVNNSALDVLANKSQSTIKRAVEYGINNYLVNLKFLGFQSHTQGCGLFNLERCTVADYDRWEVKIYTRPETGISMITNLIGTLNFIYPNASSGERNLGAGFVANGPKFCQSADCLGNKIKSVIGDFVYSPFNSSVYENEWERHRTNAANRIIAFYEDPFNLEARNLDDIILKENLFTRELIKFSLSDAVENSDTLYAIASGHAKQATLMDIVDIIKSRSVNNSEIFNLSQWMVDENTWFKKIFELDANVNLIENARQQIALNDAVNRLNNSSVLIQNLKELDTGIDSKESGGGAVNFVLIVLYLFILLFVRLNNVFSYRSRFKRFNNATY